MGPTVRSDFSSPLAIIGFVAFSFATSNLNRILFSDFFFDYGIALTIFQSALGLFILEISKFFALFDVPSYTLERGKGMILPSILYFGNVFVSVSLCHGFDNPTFNAIKRFLPLVILVFASFYPFNRCRPSQEVAVSVVVVTIGSVIAGYTNLDFSLTQSFYGFLALSLQASSLISIERVSTAGQYTVTEMIYFNTFNNLILSLVADLIIDEIRDCFTYFLTSATLLFWFTFVSALLASVLLQWAIFQCVARNSALTTGVAGNLKSIVEFSINRGIGANAGISALNWIGLLISFAGFGAYSRFSDSRESGSFI